MAGIYASCVEALRALNEGPGSMACHDFDTVREVVMCDAWHRMKTLGADHPATFKAAVDASWQDIRQACAPSGGIDHETGTPVEKMQMSHPPAAPQVESAWQIVDQAGQTVGHIAVESTGELTVCVHGDCHTDFVELPPDGREAVIAAIQDIYPTLGYFVKPEPQS